MQVRAKFHLLKIRIKVDYIALAILQLIQVFMVPPTISLDGYGYLASGESLFSGNFPHWYVLGREPGYPLLIWLTLKFRDPVLAISLVQAMLLVFSAICVSKIAEEHFHLSRRNSFLISALGLLLVRGYATTILQTALMIFVLTVGTYILMSKHMIEPRLSTRKFFLWVLYGIICASSNSATFAVVTIAFFLVWIIEKQISILHRQSMGFIIGALAIIIPWNAYLNSLDLDLNKQAIISIRNGVSVNYFQDTSVLRQNSQRIQAAGALLFLGPEIHAGLDPKMATVGGEQLIFGNPINYHQWSSCNRRFEAPQYILNFVKPLLKDQCKSTWSLNFQSTISKLILPLLPLSGIALVMNLGLAINNRDLRRFKLLIIPVLNILAYAFKGGGVSRYSSPFLIFGPLLIVLVVYQYSSWKGIDSKIEGGRTK
jgi:hypothetical protein